MKKYFWVFLTLSVSTLTHASDVNTSCTYAIGDSEVTNIVNGGKIEDLIVKELKSKGYQQVLESNEPKIIVDFYAKAKPTKRSIYDSRLLAGAYSSVSLYLKTANTKKNLFTGGLQKESSFNNKNRSLNQYKQILKMVPKCKDLPKL